MKGEFSLRINEGKYYSWGESTLSPEAPAWGLRLFTPTIRKQWNEIDYDAGASEIYSLHLRANTNIDFTISDLGLFWRLSIIVLGFGFSFYCQRTY